VALSLKPRHLSRYGDIARLLVKHGRAEGLRHEDEATAEDAEKLVNDLEAMGPTFIKFGQLLSTRADLLPPVYLEALTRLQDDVEPFSFAEVEQIVSDELGVRISKGFQSLDNEPLASASLGQVHRAVLRNGQSVVVKVQRPGVREKVAEDMDVIEELAAFVDDHTKIGRKFGFAGMVEEFRAAITAELDYLQEAENLRHMGEVLADYDEIVVPQPVADYTTSLVLTMDYVEGRNVSSLGPLAQLDFDGSALAKQLFRAYLDQILVHGFVHADPHPGNVLLTADHRLALIDLGMVTRVSPKMQDELVRLLLAISENKGSDVAAVMAGIGEHTDDYDSASFERRIVDLVQHNQSVAMGDFSAGVVVGDLARIASECGLRPPPELTMLAKALLNLDQVASKLSPDFDPNAAIRDHVGDVMRHKMLQSASPGNLLSAAMDAKEFAELLPSRVNKVMDALARGELTLNVQGIDEKELMRGIQKLANRVTTGVIVAALIIGGAMIMRVDTDVKLFGYSALAIVMLVVAALAGAWLIVSSVRNDVPHEPGVRKPSGRSARPGRT
jgi:predicted unusual protein kinase regulating ubiquinone biosynthesis (AarF/ABC1/UbiB family)